MSKLSPISLEGIIALANNQDAKKLYRLKKQSRLFEGDIAISAILDTGNVLYHYEEGFFSYRYEKSGKVFFDKDMHPYWKAYFEEENFKLYDGIFLGRYGCGGSRIYIESIQKAKNELMKNENGKDILNTFEEFYKDYKSKRDKITGDGIRRSFSLETNLSDTETESLSQYLRYEPKNLEKRDKNTDVLIFWQWFRGSVLKVFN